MAFCRDFSFALFLSRQAVTAQMRDERERAMWKEGKRESERDTEECGWKRETESLMDLIFWMGEREYILLYLCIFPLPETVNQSNI